MHEVYFQQSGQHIIGLREILVLLFSGLPGSNMKAAFLPLGPLTQLTQNSHRGMECHCGTRRWECIPPMWHVVKRGWGKCGLSSSTASLGSRHWLRASKNLCHGETDLLSYCSLCSGRAQGQNLDEFCLQIYNSLEYQRDFFGAEIRTAKEHITISS